jgi:phenylpyruvate tautomerase PptA (4-oxalocrotonate tautomerase family)
MALARIEVLRGRSSDHKRELLSSLHDAIVCALKVPPGDPAVRVVEHDPESFLLPTSPSAVSELYTLIEITMFAGRSPNAKRALYQQIVDRLGALGIPPADIVIVITESPLENWGLQGGVAASELELGFTVEV